MKQRLGVSDVVIGYAWWGLTHLWGAIVGLLLLLTPLAMANLAAELVDGIAPAIALGLGVASAYGLGVGPWDAEGRSTLAVCTLATAASVLAWHVIRGPVDLLVIVVALSVALAGWAARHALARP